MNLQKKHICVITPSFNIGGIERTVIELANFFVKKGYKVSLISLLAGTRHFTIHDEVIVIEPNRRRSSKKLLNALYRLWLISYMRISYRMLKPDVIVSMADTFNPFVLIAALKLNIPVFIGDVTKPGRRFTFFTRMGKKIMYPFSSGFIAQTNFAAGYYSRMFSGKLKIKVINGAIKQINNYDVSRKKIILNVGRLSIEKGQDRLIAAFSKIKNKMGWKLALTSDGPLKKQLFLQIKEFNMEDDILFLGNVKDIDMIYAESSIFVLPSRSEGFPNALTEAMAHGLPCVCFDSFPANEVITNNLDGIILPDGDIEGLAITLEFLMNDNKERDQLGLNARKIVDKLSIDKIGNEFSNFILS